MPDATNVASQLGAPPSGNVGIAAQMLGLTQHGQSLIQQQEADPEVKKTEKEGVTDISDAEARAEKVREGIEPLGETLKLWNADQEAAARATDPLQSFGSIGSMFALLASAFTHAPAINAMNGVAAAMNAIKKGDDDAYNRAYDAYKTNMDLALKRHAAEMDEYNAALQDARDQPALAAAKLKAASAKFQNLYVAEQAAIGNYKGVGDYINSSTQVGIQLKELQPRIQQLADQHDEAQLKINATKDFQQALSDVQAAHISGDPEKIRKAEAARDKAQDSLMAIVAPAAMIKPLTTAQMQAQAAQLRVQANAYPVGSPERTSLEAEAKQYEDALAVSKAATAQQGYLSPDAVDMDAQIFLATGTMPAMGLGSAADRAAIQNKAAELAKDQGTTVADIVSGRSAYKADAASLGNIQKMADAAASFENTVLANMQIVQNLMSKGSGTAAGPVVNRWLQAGRRATGDPDVAAFNTAMGTVMDEYAKVLSGNTTGGQRITDAARNQTEGMLSQFDSPQAIITTFNQTMKPDMENRINSYKNSLQTIRGRIAAAPTSPVTLPTAGPIQGAVEDGYRFKGGNPSDSKNWEKVQ